MKRRVLLRTTLTLTIALGTLVPVTSLFPFRSTLAFADSASSVNDNSGRAEDSVPLTDRVPWLIYVVLTTSSVALAWILFSLARARMRDTRRDEPKQP